MNHVEQFRRSINIWKLTDYEKTDIYVDMYLWINEFFKDLKEFTSVECPLSTFYGTSKDNIILEQDLKTEYTLSIMIKYTQFLNVSMAVIYLNVKILCLFSKSTLGIPYN